MIEPLVSAEQFRRRQYEIKKAVGGNGLGKMSIVNKGGPDGKTFVVSKLSYLRCDLVNDFVSNFSLALDFDHHQRSLRSDKKVDLASFVASCRVLHVGCCRKHECLFESEMRKQIVDVIQDKVLELKAEDGIPSVQLFQGGKFEEPRLDGV